jgi:hypothetical protein
LQIPVTAYLKGLTTLENISKAEIGFIKGIIKPNWMMMGDLGGEVIKIALKNLDYNKNQWEKLLESFQNSKS